jgi:hypothetical protein
MRPPEYRIYRRARERALIRLANAYPDQYQQYLEEERASYELDKGSLNSNIGGSASQLGTRADSSTTGLSSTNEGENQGDNGGEA